MHPNTKDITGFRFGELTVIELTGRHISNRPSWYCKCSCGNIIETISSRLTCGDIRSCGCLKHKDISGQRFGRLVAYKAIGTDEKQRVIWHCLCECGGDVFVPVSSLTSGNTKSCGCIRKERGNHTTHGKKGSPEFRAFHNAKDRCLNPKNEDYSNYGERGILFLWRSFEEFYAELGDKPEGMSLDRINVNGNYEPGNCRWTDVITQARNKRRTVMLTYDGKTLSLLAWCEIYGVSVSTVRNRYYKTYNTDREYLFGPYRGNSIKRKAEVIA